MEKTLNLKMTELTLLVAFMSCGNLRKEWDRVNGLFMFVIFLFLLFYLFFFFFYLSIIFPLLASLPFISNLTPVNIT